ncbi:MAG: MFS transporter [Bacillota bacterium]
MSDRPSIPPSRFAAAVRRVAEAWAHIPWNLRTLLLRSFLINFAFQVTSGLVPAFLRAAGLDVVRIGLFFSLTDATGFAAGLAGGFLADRFGRRRIILAGTLANAAGMVLFIAAHSWLRLVVVAGLWGIGNLSRAAWSAMTAEASHDGNRAAFYGLLFSASPVAGLIAPILGGLAADHFGQATAIALSFPFFALAILASLRLRESAPAAASQGPASEAGPRNGDHPRFRELWSFLTGRGATTAWMIMAMWLVAGLEMGLAHPLIPLYIQDRFGAGYTLIALNTTLQFAATAVVMLAGGFLADRVGRRGVVLVTQVFSAALLVAQPLTGAIAVFFALRMMGAAVINLAVPAWEASMVEAASPRLRASYTGVATSGFSVGLAVGGLTAGFVYELSHSLLFYGSAAMEVIILVVAARWALPAKARPSGREAARLPG